MLSIVIPTCNSEEGLARTLASLVPGAAEGVVREVVVVDAGSTDGTRKVADAAGCSLVEASGDWASRIDAGVKAARRVPWFALLAPNVFLEGEWFREAAAFADRVERTGRVEEAVATFRLVFDDFGWQARIAESVVGLAGGLFGLPLREQGLLISRSHWDRLAREVARGGLSGETTVAGLKRRAVHRLRADAVVLPDAGAGAAVPSMGRLARIALSGLGFGTVASAIDRS